MHPVHTGCAQFTQLTQRKGRAPSPSRSSFMLSERFLVAVLEPVYDEYSQLETKYEIEKGCRSKAEEYATKVSEQPDQGPIHTGCAQFT